MKYFYYIAPCFLAIAVVMLTQACFTAAVAGNPVQQVACDSANCGCAGGCDGSCQDSRRGLFGNRGQSCRNCKNVRCPECNGCFAEEYCTLTLVTVEEERTCFEVDYKTICIPKVTPPWKQRNRRARCGANGCDGSCGGACDAAGCCNAIGCNGGCDGANCTGARL